MLRDAGRSHPIVARPPNNVSQGLPQRRPCMNCHISCMPWVPFAAAVVIPHWGWLPSTMQLYTLALVTVDAPPRGSSSSRPQHATSSAGHLKATNHKLGKLLSSTMLAKIGSLFFWGAGAAPAHCSTSLDGSLTGVSPVLCQCFGELIRSPSCDLLFWTRSASYYGTIPVPASSRPGPVFFIISGSLVSSLPCWERRSLDPHGQQKDCCCPCLSRTLTDWCMQDCIEGFRPFSFRPHSNFLHLFLSGLFTLSHQ